MPLVVLLRGLNVGGHRAFRPSRLAADLAHLDVVSIGATGTFVVRRAVSRTRLRAEIARRLPFEAEIVICQGREILRVLDLSFFKRQRVPPGAVRFVSVLARLPRSAPRLPIVLPPSGGWLVKVLGREGRFVAGLYRRHMKVIGYLGSLDGLFGVRLTTRSWNTLQQIARALEPGVNR